MQGRIKKHVDVPLTSPLVGFFPFLWDGCGDSEIRCHAPYFVSHRVSFLISTVLKTRDFRGCRYFIL